MIFDLSDKKYLTLVLLPIFLIIFGLSLDIYGLRDCESIEQELNAVESALSDQQTFLIDPEIKNKGPIRTEIRKLENRRNRLKKELADCLDSVSSIKIVGVEFNQAIQYFQSQLLPIPGSPEAGPKPDNSVPLIAGKPTGIRVYINTPQSLINESAPVFISGKLLVRLRSPRGLVEEHMIESRNRALALAANQIDRGRIAHTLNFTIPSQWSRGKMEIQISAFLKRTADQAIVSSDALLRSIEFEAIHKVDVVELRVQLVNAQGNVVTPAVPEGTIRTSLNALAARLMPVAGFNISSLVFSSTQASAAGFIDFEEHRYRPLVGDAVVVAVLPNSAREVGCGRPLRRAAAVYFGTSDSTNVAEEFGHAVCGLRHPGGIRYPRYQTNYAPALTSDGQLPERVIGEFGYDPISETIFWPNAKDFMNGQRSFSGSSGAWISPFHYGILLDCFRNQEWRWPCNSRTNERCTDLIELNPHENPRPGICD
ncbi:MAG: hypothetical protein HYT79_06790 [Elusimicrobia bacterium]|nr:hypothetical protein [Elusimicrobiota bacterium]